MKPLQEPVSNRDTQRSGPGLGRSGSAGGHTRESAVARPRCLRQVVALIIISVLTLSFAQDAPKEPDKKKADASSATPAVAEANAPAKPDGAAAVAGGAAANSSATATNQDGSAKGAPDKSSDEIQLSLQGANIDMVVQWLAQTTGKTVIKHPRVQCQLTITSSKKLTKREAITLVYRALSLEGFTAIESSNAILLTPEGSEPKMSPELVDAARKDIPEGRQRLVKIFPLEHMQAVEMKEKLRGVLSDKGSLEVDDRANQLVATDYNENLKLMAELIREFDVTDSDSAVQIFPLKYADAEEVGNLVALILNVTAPGGAASKSSSTSASSSSSPPTPMRGPMGMPGEGGGPSPSSGGGSPPSTGIGSAITAPQVRLWPDHASNRLIVSAPKSKLVEVQRLLDILDTDQPEDVSVRSIPLKNVAATDLVRELQPIYQRMGGKSRKEAIEIGANDRSNSLIILSSESNFRAIEKLVASLDTEDAQEKVVQTFMLKNADAQDVAKQLQDLGRDQDSNRYPYYYFFSSSGGADKGRKKMSVVADRRRNALVVQAPPAQMPGIEKMVKELDEPITDDSLAPKIYHLKYVSAVDIEDVLNELFLKKTQQRPYFYFYDEEPQTQTDRDVGRLYGKVRITSEPYSNTIIVTSNSKESLAAVEEVLKQLDTPSDAGESTLRIGLRFAKASTVANSINILFAKNGSPPLRPTPQQGQPPQQQQPQQQQTTGSSQAGFDLEQETKEEGYFPWLGGPPDNPRSSDGRNLRPVSDLVGRVRAVADQRSNALLVSANVQYFPQVLKLIEELDAQTDQVLIEARLVEVSADFLDKLGVRWSPNGSQVFTADDFDNSILGHANATYQKGFGGLSSVNSPPASSANVLQSLTTLRSGVLDSTISMDFLVQFLRRTTDAKVLAEPQINIRDNETGRLFVGQQVPIPQYTQVSTIGSQNTSFTYKDVGVVLEVTPHINSSGDVELRIHTESSTVVPGQTVLGGSIFDTRNFRTDLTAKNGQTLVLGGIIQKQVTDTLRKTPILGDIPGLGWAFKKKDKSSREVELMVFMRPKVSRSTQQDKELLDDIYRKAPTVKQWDEEGQRRPEPKKSGSQK